MSALTAKVLAAALSLPAPYSPPERAELAAAERAAFLETLAGGVTASVLEATCEGPWSEDPTCRRRWPGPPDELAALVVALGWHESRLDARIQAGDCQAWGPAPNQLQCDGVLFPSGVKPTGFRGLERRTRWGLVVFRSVTVFQLRELPPHRQAEVVGLGEISVYEAAREAVKILAAARGTCRRTPAWATCVVSSYAGTIAYRQAPARVRTFERVLRAVRS